MDAHGYRQVTPRPPAGERAAKPFLDLSSGYVRRKADELPKQGEHAPWNALQNYVLDRRRLRRGPLTDGLAFDDGPVQSDGPAPEPEVVAS